MTKIIELTSSKDVSQILCYIAQEPEVNLFISGDLAIFGLPSHQIHIWALLEKDRWDGILLRYMDDNYVFYSQNSTFDVATVASLIKKQHPNDLSICLNGKSALISRFLPFFPTLKFEETLMARCASSTAVALSKPKDVTIRPLEKEDYANLYALLTSISEFSETYRKNDYEKKRDGWIANNKRGAVSYGVFQGKELVAVASTTADSTESCMLVGVCTKMGFRQKGYATLAVSSLLKNRFEKGEKFICLFYDNPKAGSIYHKLGFVDTAPYAMLR